MKNKKGFLAKFSGLFSSTAQLQRIVILSGVVLVLLAATFGAYYYYDRYYQPQEKAATVQLAAAEKAVLEDPNSFDKRLALAEKYMLAKRWDDALNQLAQAQFVNPTESQQQSIWLDTGVSYYMVNKFEDSIPPLQQFVDARKDEDMASLDKQLRSAAYYLGDSYLKMERYDEAVLPLEMCVTWSRTDSDAFYKLAVAYSHINEDQRAIEMLVQTTNFVPDYKDAYALMAESFGKLNMPEMVDYANGMVAYSDKDYKNAIILLKKSEDKNKEYAGTYVGLGMSYEALGDYENSLAAFQKALTLDPQNYNAQNSAQRVELLLKK